MKRFILLLAGLLALLQLYIIATREPVYIRCDGGHPGA